MMILYVDTFSFFEFFDVLFKNRGAPSQNYRFWWFFMKVYSFEKEHYSFWSKKQKFKKNENVAT